MTTYTLLFSPASRRDLRRIETYLSQRASPRIAARYVDRLVDFCETLRLAPHRGEEHSHLELGLRSVGFRNVSVLFAVSEPQRNVRIARLYYAGYTAAEEER